MRIMFIRECFPVLEGGGIIQIEAGTEAEMISLVKGNIRLGDGRIIVCVNPTWYGEVDEERMRILYNKGLKLVLN